MKLGIPLDSQNTTVVDITYRCNATCRYCQWGNKSNPLAIHLPLESVLLPSESLKALGTRRLVLSGGEPRIHPNLTDIIRYYRQHVDDLIVITNGYGLDQNELQRLLDAGATGITVSLDSTNPDEAFITRQTPRDLHAQVTDNLRRISGQPRSFEFGLNAVVSHPTANRSTVGSLLDFAKEVDLDFVKFQPIFDDGYASRNCPDLLLGGGDVEELLRIAELVESHEHPETNPPQFWRDIAALASGETLDSALCGLGSRHSIATDGKLNVCYWVDAVSFGQPWAQLQRGEADSVRKSFESEKLKCKVGYHCFCTQNLSHEWRIRTVAE